MGEASKMVEFYVLQIRLGRITIDDVPQIFREQVEAKLGG